MRERANTSYLRPKKAGCFRTVWNSYEDRTGSLGIKTMTDVTLRAMGQRPGIEVTDRRFIDDCDYYAECVDDRPERDTAIPHIEGSVLYAGYMRKSWGHFLMNSTARLWPLFQSDSPQFDKIIFFAEDNTVKEPKGNFREFLSLLGILDRCVILSEGIYHFDRLTVGDISLEMGIYYSEEFLRPFELVRKSVIDIFAERDEKNLVKGIIMARSRWNNNDAMQINIKEIEQLFKANGYETVSPETLSLSELIIRMHYAREVVSFSGSTAHNILFADGSKPLIILERCGYNNVYQIGIMKLMQGIATTIDCFYQPLFVSSTDNLTIYGITDELRRFITDRGMLLQDVRLNPHTEFERYLKIYRRHYGYGPGINTWETEQIDAIFEAYFNSRHRYSRYIDRRTPVLWNDYFSPRVIFRFLKDKIHRH